MNKEQIIFLRGIYKKLFHPPFEPKAPECEHDKDFIMSLIEQRIRSGAPLMVARFGSIELTSLENALYMKEHRSNWKYISWKGSPSFFHEPQARMLCDNAGFFPFPDEKSMLRFLELSRADMQEVDILGSWRYNELVFKEELANSIKVDRELMTPLLTDKPWTRALEGKKVLVVHPFRDTIEKQYARREKLFPGKDILPQFDLKVVKAVQSAAGGVCPEFKDWFEALDYMKAEIDKQDYDICLIGCGAYGFPLAAHCKRMGKQAIHLGGVLQLLFGIKGKRWETEGCYKTEYPYANYYNEYWVRPSEEERPKEAGKVENGCYW